MPGLRLRQAFTPVDQAQLNSRRPGPRLERPGAARRRPRAVGRQGRDPAGARALAARRPPAWRHARGSAANCSAWRSPGGAELFSAPAVWRHGADTTMFVADESGTAAYVLRGGRLARAWQNADPGTSPVLAGGLLYVYDLGGGRDRGLPALLAAADREARRRPGHWNSPVVADGHVIEPEGNANDHAQSRHPRHLSARPEPPHPPGRGVEQPQPDLGAGGERGHRLARARAAAPRRSRSSPRAATRRPRHRRTSRRRSPRARVDHDRRAAPGGRGRCSRARVRLEGHRDAARPRCRPPSPPRRVLPTAATCGSVKITRGDQRPAGAGRGGAPRIAPATVRAWCLPMCVSSDLPLRSPTT